ncbi:MAG TPA: DegT/DnrJ/EryC1/StrS family aminotransferase, partial [Ilumatobacteraceae bacterium]
PNHWLTTLRLDPNEFAATPADVIGQLRAAGIEARHGFKPMHMQPAFVDHAVVRGDVAQRLFETTVSVPSGSRLSGDDIGWVSDIIASAGR